MRYTPPHDPSAPALSRGLAADIAHSARLVYLQAGVTHAMPPANITYMEPEERAQIVRWFRAASSFSRSAFSWMKPCASF